MHMLCIVVTHVITCKICSVNSPPRWVARANRQCTLDDDDGENRDNDDDDEHDDDIVVDDDDDGDDGDDDDNMTMTM